MLCLIIRVTFAASSFCENYNFFVILLRHSLEIKMNIIGNLPTLRNNYWKYTDFTKKLLEIYRFLYELSLNQNIPILQTIVFFSVYFYIYDLRLIFDQKVFVITTPNQ